MVDFKSALARHIKAIGDADKPSMHPQPRVTRERAPKEPERIPDISEVGLAAAERLVVRKLVVQAVEQKMIQRQAKKVEEPLVERIKGFLGPLGRIKAMVGETRLSHYPSSRSSISKHLLLAQGVDPEVIAKATVTSASWSLKLGLPGEETDDE